MFVGTAIGPAWPSANSHGRILRPAEGSVHRSPWRLSSACSQGAWVRVADDGGHAGPAIRRLADTEPLDRAVGGARLRFQSHIQIAASWSGSSRPHSASVVPCRAVVSRAPWPFRISCRVTVPPRAPIGRCRGRRGLAARARAWSGTSRRSATTTSTREILPRLTADDLKDIGVTSSATGASCSRRSPPCAPRRAGTAARGRGGPAPDACRGRARPGRAPPAHGDVRRPGRLDRALGAARSRGHARGPPRLPGRGRGRGRRASRATSPSSWATACWPTSAGPRRTRTRPSGRSGPGSPSPRRSAGCPHAGGRAAGRAGRHRDRAGRGRRPGRRGRGAGGGGGRRDARTSRPGCRRSAEPGAVVVAEATRRLLGGLFELEDLPAPRAQGLRRAACGPARVLGEGLAESRFEALHAARPHPAGRPRARARRSCSSAGTGPRTARARSSCSAGEPGIGKSRLLRALRERLADEPHTAAQPLLLAVPRRQRAPPGDRPARAGGGLRAATTPPARKLDKLEALLARGDGRRRPRPRRSLAALLSRPDRRPLPAPGRSRPQRQKERTLRGRWSTSSRAWPRAQPVLALYEDVHWVDPTTLELLDLVVDRVRTPAGAGGRHLPAGVRAALDRRTPTSPLLTLSRLGRRQGAAMVERVAGGKALPPEVLEQIVARDRRRAAVRRGADQGGARVWACSRRGRTATRSPGPLPPLAIPATLQDSLMARLDRLRAGQGGGADRRRDRPRVLARAPGRGRRAAGGGARRTRSEQLVAAGLVFRRGGPARGRSTRSSTRWCRTPPTAAC